MGENARGNDRRSRILLIEDDSAVRRTLEEIFRLEGFDVVNCMSANESITCLRQDQEIFDAMVVDLRLPDMDEQQFLQVIGPYFQKIPAIINTGYRSFESAKTSLNLGAMAYVEKGSDPNELILQVHRAIEIRLRRYTQSLEEDLLFRDRAINASTQGISITDPNQSDHPVIYVNHGFEKLTGYSAEEVLGRNMRFLQGVNTDLTTIGAMRKAVQNQSDYSGEILNYRKDGTAFWNRLTITPVHDKTNQLTHFITVHTDITKLRESEQNLKLAQKIANIGNWSWDLITDKIEWSDQVYAIFKAPRQAINFEMIKAFVHPDDMELWSHTVQQAVEKQESFSLAYRAKRPDGETIWVQNETQTIFDEQGDFVGFHGTVQNITRRKQLEEELLKIHHLLETWMKNSPAVAFIKDLEGYITYVNTAFEKLFSLSPGEIIGKTDYDLYPTSPETAKMMQANDQRIIRLGKMLRLDETVIVAGEPRHFESIKFPLHDSENNIVSVAGLAVDITQRKKVEEENRIYQKQLKSLASQLTRAQEIERQKLSKQLHDNISQRLTMAKLTLQRCTQSITDANLSEKLMGISTDIRQIVEDSYSLQLELSNPILYEMGLVPALESLLTSSLLKDQDIQCNLMVPKECLKLDQDLRISLYQAVRELLVNIVKHAKAQVIDLIIKKENDNLRVSVKDDGIGIDSSVNKQPGKEGGFGLFNIKESLEGFGAKLTIESQIGKGTVATITAPLVYESASEYQEGA